MNKYAVLVAANKKVLAQVGQSFGNDPQVMAWATNPNDWEIYEPGYVDADGYTFDDAIESYVENEEEIPVAVAYLKPDELESQVVYPVYDRNGVYVVVGDNHGD